MIVFNQGRNGTCANFAIMGVLANKGIKFDCNDFDNVNGFTYPIVEKLFVAGGLMKKSVGIPTPKLVDFWLNKGEWLVTKVSKGNFKNPPNVTMDGASIHFFVIIEDLGDKWKCLNSWGEGWGDGGCFYIQKKDFKSLFIPRRIII